MLVAQDFAVLFQLPSCCREKEPSPFFSIRAHSPCSFAGCINILWFHRQTSPPPPPPPIPVRKVPFISFCLAYHFVKVDIALANLADRETDVTYSFVMPSLKILTHSHLFPQCSALIDEASKEDFVEEIKEEYEEIRDEHYDSLKVRVFLFTRY